MNSISQFFFFLICLVATPAIAQNTWTLSQTLDLAKRQALASRVAADDRQIADSEWKIFQKANLPRLSLNGNLPNFSSAFQEVIQPDGNVLFSPVRNNNSYLGLRLSQNLPMTGGVLLADVEFQRYDDLALKEHQYFAQPFRLSYYQPFFQSNEAKWNKKLAPLQKELAYKQYRNSQNLVAQVAADRFFTVLLQQQLLQMAQDQLSVTQQLYTIAEKRYSLGHLSKSNLLQLEVQELSAKQNIRQLQQNSRRAEQQLLVFLDASDQKKLSLLSPPVPPQVDQDLERIQSKALLNDPILEELRLNLMQTQKRRADLKSEAGWQAGLYASVGWSKSSESFNEVIDQPKLQQSLELRFSLPLVDWGTQKQRSKQVDLAQSKLEKQIAFRQKEIRNEVALILENYRQLKTALEVAQKIESLATERYEIVKQQFILEKINLTELTIATTEKEANQTAYLNLLQETWSSYLQLQAYENL